MDARAEKAEAHIPPISVLPISLDLKAELIASKTAGARYGLALERPTEAASNHFDQAILGALNGNKFCRCKATCMALNWKGHKIFMDVAAPYEAVTQAARQLRRGEPWKRIFEESWNLRTLTNDTEGCGPVAHQMREAGRLNWKWQRPF